MRSETAYEVYSYGDRRWMMEARFAAEAKNDAYVLANELRRQQGIETVRIVREIWDPRSNGFSEVTIYEVRGPGRGRAGTPQGQVFGTMNRAAERGQPSSAAVREPPRPDPTLRILGRLLLIVAAALMVAAFATMAGQTFWSVGSDGKIGLFLIVLLGALTVGLMLGVSRADWRRLIAEPPPAVAAPRRMAAPPPPIQRRTGNPAAGGPETATPPSPADAVADDEPAAVPDKHVRAEVRLLDFLQQSLADPRLGPAERGSFQAFVFTIGAVDALAREDGLDRPARLALLEACGVALGIDAATVTHTLDNIARTVSRSDGLALAQAGMRAMLDRLAGTPFAHGLADALAAQQALQDAHEKPDRGDNGIAIAVGLNGLDHPSMADTRKRIDDMVAYHRGFAVTFRPDAVSACFSRPTEALIAALALAAVIQPIGGTRGRPRFGLGDTLAGAAAAMAAAEPGEIVANAAFDATIRVGLGEDLPPGYRALGTAPVAAPAESPADAAATPDPIRATG